MSGIGSFIEPGKDVGTSSAAGAFVNLLCTVVGTGLLNLPQSAAHSGWIGLPLLLLLGLTAGYTSHLVVRCLNILNGKVPKQRQREITEMTRDPSSSQPNVALVAPVGVGGATAGTLVDSYGDIGEAAFGCFGRWMVNVQLHMTLVGVGTIYHILGALNLKILFPDLSQASAVLIVAGLLWPHVFLKTLGEVAWVSYINAGVTFTLEVVVIGVALTSPPDYPVHTVFVNTENLMSFGGAFAGFTFAFGVHCVVPAVYGTMKQPEQFSWVNFFVIGASLLLYVPMVVVGYGIYGDQVAAPIYQTPAFMGRWEVTFCVYLITALVLMSYIIVINIPERALESVAIKDSAPLATLRRVLLRTGFLGLTGFASIAIGVDKFGPALNLISSVTNTCTCFIFPALFYLKICSGAGIHVSVFERLCNVLIVCGTSVGGVFGFVSALQEFGVL